MAYFRGPFKCQISPRFHHEFALIYHAKHHVLRTKIRKNPLKNEGIATQI
jgi:hypothetical protein